ncbi:MAG: hypothetical protein NTW82_02275, partial [Bacteroidia bacterium]|nr:hypothetical protein [Bacteroidia bacterium]
EFIVGTATGNSTVAITGDVAVDETGDAQIQPSVVTTSEILDETILNDDIDPAAGIEFSKLESLASANIILGSAGAVPTATAVSGDATINNTGVVTVGRINGTPLGSTAATNSNILVADGTQWNSVDMEGDATIDNAGTLTLAITGVTAAIYGDATHVGQFTVDDKGRLTNAIDVLITGVSPVGSSLGSGNIWVGDAGNLAEEVSMSGDVHIDNTGLTTIQDNSVAVTNLEALADGEFIVGTDGTAAGNTKVTIGGDVVIDNTGDAQIQAGVVTATEIATDAVGGDEIVSGAVTTSEIADGSIMNIDVNAAAAIEGTKISPDFGNQTVTIGTGTGATAGTIVLHDAAAGSSFTTTIQSNATVLANFTLTLPADDGTANQLLQTNGSGALSWISPSALDPDMSLADLNNVGSDLATSGRMLIADGDSWESQAISGDVLIDATGVTAIQDGSVSVTNLEALADGEFIVGTDGTAAGNTKVTIGGDVVVSNTGDAQIQAGVVTATEIATDAVTSAEILSGAVASDEISDGTIMNVDVNAAAAIAGTKINPNFGDQTVTIGTGTGATAGKIVLNDATGGTTNTANIQAPTNVTTTYALTLPSDAGSVNQVLTNTGSGNLSWTTPTTGTVTSFSAGDLSPLFTTIETNPTTTPALSFTLSNAGAYTVFGNNTAASATPAYFTPVLASALFQNQGATTSVLHGNATGNPSWGQIVNNDITNGTIDLTAKVAGILPSANGGTGNGFTKFTGPTTSEKTFTLPDASGTIALTNTAWMIGGNAPGGTRILGTTDNSGINIQSGTGTINLGADAFAKTINIGNATGTTAVNINTGTGASTFVTTGTGTLVIGGAASTGALTFGSSSNAQTVNIGTGNVTGTGIVNVGTGTATGSKTVNIATDAISTVSISSGAFASTVNIGNNSTGADAIAIGSANASSTLNLEGGTATNAIQIGNGATAHGIQIGSGAAVNTLVLGSTNTTSTTTINSGTGGLNLSTGAATPATTTLGTTGSQVFASSTPSSDMIAIKPQSTTATGAFTGTITTNNLTAARTYTFPDVTGTVALTNTAWAITGNAGTNPASNFVGTTDDNDLVFKANSTERARIVSSTGDIKIGDANTGTLRATKELVLRQDGDIYGTSLLRLRSRTGENGAIFETTHATAWVTDFIFKTAVNQRNFRYEARVAYARAEDPSFHIGGSSPDSPTLSIGDNYSVFRGALRVGDNSTYPTLPLTPTAWLHLSAGTAAASTAPLKFTTGAFLTTPEAGAVEYNGTNFFVTNGTANRYTLAKTLTATLTYDLLPTASMTSQDFPITVTGAAIGDVVALGIPNTSNDPNSSYSAWVSAANTVIVRFNNYSAAAIDPADGTYRVSVLKY